MNFKDLIKNILINEVGEASHRTFRTKRDVSNFENKYQANKERDDFSYEFTTEKGFKYSVNLRREIGQKFSYSWGSNQEQHNKEELADFYNKNRAVYINLRKAGATREDFLNIWAVSFQVDEAPDEYYKQQDEDEDEEEVYDRRREAELRDNLEHVNYGSWTTNHSSEHDEDPTIDNLEVSPEDSSSTVIYRAGEDEEPSFDNSEESNTTSNHPGREIPSSYERVRFISTSSDINAGEFFRVMATVSKIIKNHVEKYNGRIINFAPADERRGRIFTRYILTQIPGTKSYVNNNDFYFLINA
jgi:hypothetical protein